MSFDATKTSIILQCSSCRAQYSPAIGSRIGAVVVEQSAIEFLDRQHLTIFSPVTSSIIALSGCILSRMIACIESRNLNLLDSGSVVWLWWSVAPVARECGCWSCGPGLGVWMLRVVIRRLYPVASCLRLSAENPPGSRDCYGYHSHSHWTELAFLLLQR